MTICERIKGLREDHDLTQETIAQILHISQRTYSHYENGTRSLPLDIFIQIADYYDVSLDYLAGRKLS